MKKIYIAIDLGAENGRVILGQVSDSRLNLQEVHRFSNSPIMENGSLRWDFDYLLSEIKAGIAKTVKVTNEEISGIGIDSWGVDFGLIDKKGRLIENPYHYRDSRTNGMMDKAFELIPKKDIYFNTGIQFMQLNTVYQLLAMKTSNSDLLQKTNKLIFMADLVAYHLCGKIFAEYTLASTSQLMNLQTGRWSEEIFDKLLLPIDIMPGVVKAGMVVGKLKSELAGELGATQLSVIAVGSHDTASAIAAVPAKGDSWAYLSSGTWSLMGVEVPSAIINETTYKYQFTNEGGVANTIRLLKNIMGLWIVQECRHQWQAEGEKLSYSQLADLAQKAQPFAGYINPNDSCFFSPGRMPAKINDYLKQAGQNITDDYGQIVRIVLESLAFNYRWVLERIEEVTGKQIDVLHIVGGGIQNELLCQFTADATGKKVVAGPVEATAIGNIIMQAIATGQLKSVSHGREIVKNSIKTKKYLPSDSDVWTEKYKRARKFFDV